MIILSVIAGVVTWISNALVERLYYYGPTRSFWDLLLLDVPPEEFYDRIITMAAFLLLGIIVARMLEKRIASEATSFGPSTCSSPMLSLWARPPSRT